VEATEEKEMLLFFLSGEAELCRNAGFGSLGPTRPYPERWKKAKNFSVEGEI
jgi:hypothetical protein